MTKKLNLPIEEIIDLYINKRVSTTKIGKLFNCHSVTIIRLIKRNNIKLLTDGKFKKGNLSHNKGKNKENYFSLKIASEKMMGKIKTKEHIQKIREKTIERYKKGFINPMKSKKRPEQSERMKLNNPMFNKESLEKRTKTRKKLYNEGKIKSAFKKGCKRPEISGKNHPMYGKHHTEETKLKIKETNIISGNYKENSKRMKLNNPTRNIDVIRKIKEYRAKQIFPVKDTSIEVKIQNFLKVLGIEYFTHQYMKDIEHGYQCDILIPSMNLVIECDGDYWHKYPIGKDIDHIRTKELIEKGFKVLRLWECEIKEMDIENFKEKIKYDKE